jgi:hypothetical protein
LERAARSGVALAWDERPRVERRVQRPVQLTVDRALVPVLALITANRSLLGRFLGLSLKGSQVGKVIGLSPGLGVQPRANLVVRSVHLAQQRVDASVKVFGRVVGHRRHGASLTAAAPFTTSTPAAALLASAARFSIERLSHRL